jgi:hypothetical protein
VNYVIAVVIGVGLPYYQDPCTPATQLATDATANMKAG